MADFQTVEFAIYLELGLGGRRPMRVSKEIPSGPQFLLGTGKGKLKKLLKREKNAKKALRIQACLKRKKGMSIPRIAEEIEVPYPTVHRWLLQVARGGLAAIGGKKHPGPKWRLDEGERRDVYKIVSEDPEEHGFAGGAWTARRLIAVVEKRFNVTYTERGMQLFLHRIGLSCKAPRPRHPNAATPEEMARFKRQVAALRGHWSDYDVCMIDSASLIAGWNMQRGWYPRGKSAYAPCML